MRLTVEFIGLNIHFSRLENQNLNLPYPRRVVIPHSDKPLTWKQNVLPPHEPFLRFGKKPHGLPDCLRAETDGSHALHRVTLRILGGMAQAKESSLPLDPLRCVPHLKHLWPEMVLDDYAVTNGNEPAAAYFDIEHGRLEGRRHDHSAASALIVDFDTPVAHLQIDCWDGGSHTIELHLPEKITIRNTGPKDDDPFDAVLNLLLASNFPPAELPHLGSTMALAEKCLGIGKGPPPPDLGIGCSNSQFP